jgi:hydrogenase maturation protein HypF
MFGQHRRWNRVVDRLADSKNKKRLKIHIQGAVQGVGFRPFVFRLANLYKLCGWVRNQPDGVHIEIEGDSGSCDMFLCRLEPDAPGQAHIQSLKHITLDPAGYTDFNILESTEKDPPTVWMMPDIATCPNCLRDIFDKRNKRYLYPFTNCTQCGPRFTIIESLPYDRRNTSIKHFEMCPECQAEYDNPHDRRFHAQPNACPQCGPHLELWNADQKISMNESAIEETVRLLQTGNIVAVKGLGGFHLMTDATNSSAVIHLRKRKNREERPFALMFPDLEIIGRYCHLTPLEKRWLTAPEAPILLLFKKPDAEKNLAEEIAPGNPCLGTMLPYTPLHHILLSRVRKPLIATSGNRSDEPICIGNEEALKRLKGIADYFLMHDRPIVRPVDDSVGRIISGREMLIRRARGYAPLPVIQKPSGGSVLAVGGHLKNTIALSSGDRIIVSQHIGDLDTEEAVGHFIQIREDLESLTGIHPDTVLHDLHPDYGSTREAFKISPDVKPVQHHLAHIMSCMIENEIVPPVLGVSWDGMGLGTDGTLWGGEFIRIRSGQWTRHASFRRFRLIGGDTAAREPRRSALGILHTCYGKELNEAICPPVTHSFSQKEWDALIGLLYQDRIGILTSSAGRLFDAVASITGIAQVSRYEGQSAMQVEYAAWQSDKCLESYPFILNHDTEYITVDWEPMIRTMVDEVKSREPAADIANRFHSTLAAMVLDVASQSGEERIVLSGGCFQNKLLSERVISRLSEAGHQAYWHQHIPPNDGGISLGQIGAWNHHLIL